MVSLHNNIGMVPARGGEREREREGKYLDLTHVPGIAGVFTIRCGASRTYACLKCEKSVL